MVLSIPAVYHNGRANQTLPATLPSTGESEHLSYVVDGTTTSGYILL